MGYKVKKPDWLCEKDGEFVCFEIKEKSEPFGPPPFYGHGLDLRQLYLRERLRKFGIRTILLIFDNKDKKIYHQYLDVLESKDKHDTPHGIRVYPLESFNVLEVERI